MAKRLIRVLSVAAAGLVLICCGIFLFESPSAARVENEQYAVYSAYLSRALARGTGDSSAENDALVILEHSAVITGQSRKSQTDNLRELLGSMPFVERALPQVSTLLRSQLLVANLRVRQFRRQFALPVRYHLAADIDIALFWTGGVAAFRNRFPDSYGNYLTFTRVGFNRELTEAVFYTEDICGLCGGGKYVYMRKIDGRWWTQGEAWRWIS